MNTCDSFAVIELKEQTIIAEVADRLTRKYSAIPPDTVRAVVRHAHERFDGRPVREYIPLLVERYAEKELSLASFDAGLIA